MAIKIQDCFEAISLDLFAGEIPKDSNVLRGVSSFPFYNGDDFPQPLFDR